MNMLKNILIARDLSHELCGCITDHGFNPIPCMVTQYQPIDHSKEKEEINKKTFGANDILVITSPMAARLIAPRITTHTRLILTKASAKVFISLGVFTNYEISNLPDSESLISKIVDLYPKGGTFFLIRGKQSQEIIEKHFDKTPWFIVPIITHYEVPVEHVHIPQDAEAYLALSPIQASCFMAKAPSLKPLGWGKLVEERFVQLGLQNYLICEPTLEGLSKLLKIYSK